MFLAAGRLPFSVQVKRLCFFRVARFATLCRLSLSTFYCFAGLSRTCARVGFRHWVWTLAYRRGMLYAWFYSLVVLVLVEKMLRLGGHASTLLANAPLGLRPPYLRRQ